MVLLETSNALHIAHKIGLRAAETLSETGRRIYTALVGTALEVSQERKYHPNTSQVTFFSPVDSVAMAVGVSRQTIYNRLPELVERGLVEQTAHFCTLNGQTRADGSLWAVKLVPELPGKAKIDFSYMKQSYRDLGTDIQAGRTAWSALQSYSREDNEVDISYILAFALTPNLQANKDDCKADEALALESLLDVAYAPVAARNEAVDNAAKAVASHLGSSTSSLNFYRWLIWALLRLEKQGVSYFYQVFLLVQRAGVDRRENACKNAGGLFVSRLKQSGIWKELREVKHTRVGTSPPN